MLRLLAWFSPGFPIGAFSYSHGIEWAVEAGLVATAADLEDWLRTVLRAGGGRSDALLFAAAWRAASNEDCDELIEVAELALACRGTSELALESTAQGTAFLTTVRAAWPHEDLEALTSGLGDTVALPVAAGLACAVSEFPLEAALCGYLQSSVANLVSAGVRLIPLGQTDGQRVLASLEAEVLGVALEAQRSGLDSLGGAALGVDLASMQHETQYTRLFRS